MKWLFQLITAVTIVILIFVATNTITGQEPTMSVPGTCTISSSPTISSQGETQTTAPPEEGCIEQGQSIFSEMADKNQNVLITAGKALTVIAEIVLASFLVTLLILV